MKIGVFFNRESKRRTPFANVCVRDEEKILKRVHNGGEGNSVKNWHGRKYTQLYKKGIKKDQNKSMETTGP